MPWVFFRTSGSAISSPIDFRRMFCYIINQPILNRSTEQVDDGDEGDLLKQALAMSMTDGEEFENMRVSF